MDSRQPVAAAARSVHDVSLDAQGNLNGKLVDANGRPQAAAVVVLKQNGQVAAQSKTDESGQFAVAGVRAGLYEISAAQGSGAYRVWAHRSAPPSATASVLLVNQTDVLRGQSGGWGHIMLVTGLIITAGVIGGVIGYNMKDDDDNS
jgi:hypothetical protein